MQTETQKQKTVIFGYKFSHVGIFFILTFATLSVPAEKNVSDQSWKCHAEKYFSIRHGWDNLLLRYVMFAYLKMKRFLLGFNVSCLFLRSHNDIRKCRL